MKRQRFLIVSIIGFLVLGLWAWCVYQTPMAPLTPRFCEDPTPTSEAITPGNQLFSEPDERTLLKGGGVPTLAVKSSSSDPAVKENLEIETVCDGPPVTYILATGVDAGADIHTWGLSDIIMVARIDLVNQELSVLSIPRDLWVPMYGLEEYDVTEFKINSAYFYGNLYHYPGGGPVFLAKVLYDNFGIQVDHYLSVNKTAFVALIDSLGGVDVTFPENSNSGVNYLYSGTVHFSGEDALDYMRFRKDSTWNRADRALYFIYAIRNQVLKSDTTINLVEMMKSLQYGVVTDLSPKDISMMMCVASEINLNKINFYEISPEMTEQSYIGKYWVLLPNEEMIEEHIQDFMAGIPSEYEP